MVQPPLTRLSALWRAERFKLGYPSWTAPTPWWLRRALRHELNNYGDPAAYARWPWNTKDAEQAALAVLAGMFHAPPGWYGYITSGSSEGILYGLLTARTRHPDGILFHSAAAHPAVAKAAEVVGWQSRRVVVPAGPAGAIDVEALAHAVHRFPERAPVIVATIGTTMTEAMDDVTGIRAMCPGAFIHADAAFLGVPAAARYQAQGRRPPFGFGATGVDSLSWSMHKFLGIPMPCGGVIVGPGDLPFTDEATGYTGTTERTLGSSRSGHAPLLVWHHLNRLGPAGLLAYADHCSAVAAYAVDRITGIGWDAWRAHEHAATVVLKTPPEPVLDRWVLACDNGLAHLVCTPGVTRRRVDRFVSRLRSATTGQERS